MYSGTTFRHHSGNIVGVHQRIDRVARRHLVKHLDSGSFFPSIRTILHFEGKNGPDGIKSKSPSIDEPWHYIQPTATADDPLVHLILDHMHNLHEALAGEDEVRAGFEAAWLAHAVVDGLTPAHHYPLAEKIEELWGKAHTERKTKRQKIFIPATSTRESLRKNWQYWGAKGVFSLHWSFEWGVAAAVTVNTFRDISLSEHDLLRVEKEGFVAYFLESLRAVDSLGMYEEFARTGWSVRLGNMTRKKLAPLLMRTVALAWYAASKGIFR